MLFLSTNFPFLHFGHSFSISPFAIAFACSPASPSTCFDSHFGFRQKSLADFFLICLTIGYPHISQLLLVVLILGLLAFVLYKTRLGMVVRAAVSDADMVNALGINVPVLFMFVFGAGTWLAGLAGVAIAPILTVFPGLADQMGMDAFIVVIVGGFGSLGGALLVAIICGLLSSYGVQFISQLAPVLMFIFMAVVLAFKPMGLFGERE